MYIQEALHDYLLEQSALTDLIGSKLYYVKAVQKVVSPYTVMTKISDSTVQSHEGNSHQSTARMQFSTFALTYVETLPIAAVIKSILTGYKGLMGEIYVKNILFDDEGDGYEPETGLFHLRSDYLVQYKS
jgi:hypothetical protein